MNRRIQWAYRLATWCMRKGMIWLAILTFILFLIFSRRACDTEASCTANKCPLEDTLFIERLFLTNRNNQRRNASDTGCADVHLVTVCVGSNATRDFVVLLKSILFHRNAASLTRLHFHIITLSEQHDAFRTLLSTWHIPALDTYLYNAQDYLSLVNWIPTTHYSGVAGLLKLAIGEVLPDSVERAIVIDTDMLVLCDLRDTLGLFEVMHGTNASLALVENQSGWYLQPNGATVVDEHNAGTAIWPANGRGYNTGLMLVDLGRLRSHRASQTEMQDSNFRSLLTSWLTDTAKRHVPTLRHAPLGDQDVVNALLFERPQLALTLGCEWNLQFSKMSMASQLCPHALTFAKIVHWNMPQKATDADLTELDLEQEVSGGPQSVVRALYASYNELDGYVLAASQFDPACLCASAPAHCSQKLSPQPTVRVATSASRCALMRVASHQTYRTHTFYVGSAVATDGNLANAVGLVTQLGFERLSRLAALAAHWDGPISAAVFLRDNQLGELLRAARAAGLLARADVALHVVFRHGHDAYYPVNVLRNVALNASRAAFALLVDVDFLPPHGLFAKLSADRTLHRDAAAGARRAYVVPAFETTEYRYETANGKLELLAQLERGVVRPFRASLFPRGHAPTDYARWSHATLPYAVDWQTDFEPFVAIRVRDEHGFPLQSAPRFDERFVGFGWNKIAFTIELDARGYDFYVLPDAFVVHAPHALSEDVQLFRADADYRRCLDALKRAFVRDYLSVTYGARALKYLATLD